MFPKKYSNFLFILIVGFSMQIIKGPYSVVSRVLNDGSKIKYE